MNLEFARSIVRSFSVTGSPFFRRRPWSLYVRMWCRGAC